VVKYVTFGILATTTLATVDWTRSASRRIIGSFDDPF